MAKFELPIYNAETGEIDKTVTRGFMPVSLYVKFQKFSEKLIKDEEKTDAEMFTELQPLFCELFTQLTKSEYLNCTDTAEVLRVYGDVMNKSTQITAGDSKNV